MLNCSNAGNVIDDSTLHSTCWTEQKIFAYCGHCINADSELVITEYTKINCIVARTRACERKLSFGESNEIQGLR